MSWRVGVDSGGTFTDVCLFDEQPAGSRSGRCRRRRTIRRAASPRASRRACAASRPTRRPPAAAVGYFGHGTTVATNALIQHRGVKTGLITTDGFRDLLEIGRQKRPDLYDIQADKPPILVPRDLRLEVPERVRHDGEVETPLDEDGGARRGARAEGGRRAGGRRVASSTASSGPSTSSARVASSREEMPDAFISAGHEIAPEFREFERLSTVVLNAYLGPVMQRLHRAASARGSPRSA